MMAALSEAVSSASGRRVAESSDWSRGLTWSAEDEVTGERRRACLCSERDRHLCLGFCKSLLFSESLQVGGMDSKLMVFAETNHVIQIKVKSSTNVYASDMEFLLKNHPQTKQLSR